MVEILAMTIHPDILHGWKDASYIRYKPLNLNLWNKKYIHESKTEFSPEKLFLKKKSNHVIVFVLFFAFSSLPSDQEWKYML
jgi:hypothetical protein